MIQQQKTTIKGTLINVSRGKTSVEVAYKQIKGIVDSNKENGSRIAYQKGLQRAIEVIEDETNRLSGIRGWIKSIEVKKHFLNTWKEMILKRLLPTTQDNQLERK